MTKIKPRPTHSFPSQITVDLPEFQRKDLDSLYILHQSHDDTEQEFFQLVMAYGILSMLDEQSEVGAGKREAAVRPFPAISLRYKNKRMRDEQRADLDQGDVGLADVPQEPGDKDEPTELQERVRQRFEDFLLEHGKGMSEEAAFQMLLDLGLRHAVGETPSVVVERAKNAARRRQMIRQSHRG